MLSIKPTSAPVSLILLYREFVQIKNISSENYNPLGIPESILVDFITSS